MRNELRQEHLRLLAHSDNIVNALDEVSVPPRKEGGGHGEEPVLADETEEGAYESFVNDVGTRAGALVEITQSVTHTAVCLYGHDMGSPRRQVDIFPLRHVKEAFTDIGTRQAPKLVALTARKNGHGNSLGFGRRQDKDDMGRRLFQCLQQSIEGFRRQHVDFVDNVYLTPPFRRHELHRLAKLANVFDAAVRRGVDFCHVQRLAACNVTAYAAVVAGCAVGPWTQFTALAKILAVLVLPVPRGPEKR